MGSEASQTERASWRDLYEMCKPRVVLLMLLTSLIGMCLATPSWVPWRILLWGNIGIALAASSAAALNHVADRYIDQKMLRTHARPIAKGRVSARAGVWFSLVTATASLLLLFFTINTLMAVLTFCSIVGYAGIYSFYLKHATPQNIVIGGVAGAAPPMLGWVAVTGQIDPGAWALLLIIFVWTPPHFWALAIARIEEYRKARLPMLPVMYGIPYTKTAILQYTVLLVLVTLIPIYINMSGWIYVVTALVLNVIFLWYVIWLKRSDEPSLPMRVFRFSISYLMFLFLGLMVDHYCFYSVWSQTIH